MHSSSLASAGGQPSPDLTLIPKLGQDSHQLSMGIVLLVDGELAAWLQLFLGVDDTNIIDDSHLLLRIS